MSEKKQKSANDFIKILWNVEIVFGNFPVPYLVIYPSNLIFVVVTFVLIEMFWKIMKLFLALRQQSTEQRALTQSLSHIS